ncbi:MAG: methylenetetrahydrofolate reductase [Lysobacterales bacterium]|jgi:methylenetetrahydrofolate reductase (NADPH)
MREGRFALTAELTLTRDSSADDVRRQADLLGRYVDAVQVSDNPYAWVQMSALSTAAILIDHGIDAIPILGCRDRNRDALRSELLGMRSVGVGSLILMRGHGIPRDHALPARAVFDTTGQELIQMAAAVDRLVSMPAGDDWLIGTGARVFRANRGWRAESLVRRHEAGARFLQSQLCFNLDILRHYMARFVEAGYDRKYRMMVSLSPLPSVVTARWIKKNLSDSRLPERIIEQLAGAEDPAAEGVAQCAELMQAVSGIEGVSGIHLMTTGEVAPIVEALEASGLGDR